MYTDLSLLNLWGRKKTNNSRNTFLKIFLPVLPPLGPGTETLGWQWFSARNGSYGRIWLMFSSRQPQPMIPPLSLWSWQRLPEIFPPITGWALRVPASLSTLAPVCTVISGRHSRGSQTSATQWSDSGLIWWPTFSLSMQVQSIDGSWGSENEDGSWNGVVNNMIY